MSDGWRSATVPGGSEEIEHQNIEQGNPNNEEHIIRCWMFLALRVDILKISGFTGQIISFKLNPKMYLSKGTY